MSKRSLLVAISTALAGFASAATAHAATAIGIPGTPVDPLVRPTVNLFEAPLEVANAASESAVTRDLITTVVGGACDGYVVLSEADGGVSDVVVFHDGLTLPSGVCGPTVHFVTFISDTESGLSLTNVPPNRAGLTIATVNAGAGANATVTIPEQTALSHRDMTVYMAHTLADGGGGVAQYRFLSDAPALPPWAFLVLGVTLLGSAVFIFQRRGRGQESTTV